MLTSERPGRAVPVLGLALLWALLLVALAPPALDARPAKEDWWIEPTEWDGTLAAGGVLTVRNPYGDVRARRADGETVAVYTMMQRHREDPREWRIEIAEQARGLAVEVVLAAGPVPEEAAADWALRRVDMTVYVPAGARLEVETGSGLIEAKRLRSDVAARSASGEIVVTTTGSVEASSEAGRIRYSFLDAGWAGTARLATGAGDVHVTLPAGANVDLAIRTRGSISTDGAVRARAREAMPREASAGPAPALETFDDPSPTGLPAPRELRAVVGAGGGSIAIASDSGDVEIRRIPG